MDDRAVVASQLGRQPRAFRRVAVRCPFGRPAVTEQEPYDAAGEPFPTTYYLTCPHLVAAVSRLEAAGGVERWAAVDRDPELAASLARATEQQRRSGALSPAAGPAPTAGRRFVSAWAARRIHGSLKCLHAHAAYALAWPDHELGRRILEEVEDPWPAAGCCTRWSTGNPPTRPVAETRPRLPARSQRSTATTGHHPLASIAGMSSLVEIARQEWADGYRRVEAERGTPSRYHVLHGQIDAITEQLRRRLGAVYTLSELAAEYRRAESWAREAIAQLPLRAQWQGGLTIATDAAFYLYARGAQDYEP